VKTYEFLVRRINNLRRFRGPVVKVGLTKNSIQNSWAFATELLDRGPPFFREAGMVCANPKEESVIRVVKLRHYRRTKQ
jgi:hypothetical protein